MANTVQDQLNNANPNDIHARWQQVRAGDMVAGMIPALNARTGLASSATQVHDKAATLLAVSTGAGALRTIVNPDVTPGATEVQVTYDSDGLATLVFNAAVTAYDATEMALPAALGVTLALEV